MKKNRIKASKEYDVVCGRGVSADIASLLGEIGIACGSDVFIVSDTNVWGIYSDKILKLFDKYNVSHFVFASGEKSKNKDTLFSLLEKMAGGNMSRDCTVVAFGGGVVCDVASLAAALYMRGVGCVLVPTSLLAMVDAAVGGKCAVDLESGKNLVGVFSQPKLVVCDTAYLDTLPEEEYSRGMAEVIKYAAIGCGVDPDEEKADELVYSCVCAKASFVENDEFDRGERKKLNFGHTFAHAIELLSNYTVSHGEAVSLGMMISAKGSGCSDGAEKLEKYLENYGLPTACPYTAAQIAEAAFSDKKRRGDRIDVIVMKSFGEVGIQPMNLGELEAFTDKALKK